MTTVKFEICAKWETNYRIRVVAVPPPQKNDEVSDGFFHVRAEMTEILGRDENFQTGTPPNVFRGGGYSNYTNTENQLFTVSKS